MNSIELSVVICTRNREHLLGDCLEAVLNLAFPESAYQVIVVDNGSIDATAIRIKEFQTKYGTRLKYVFEGSPGLNAARNAGIRAAEGRIVVFLDDDEIPQQEHLQRISDWFGHESNLDGVGGPYRDRGGTQFRTCSECKLAEVDVPGTGLREVPRLLGGNMAIKKEVFQTNGIFDETIIGRGDESEWFYRGNGKFRFLQDPELWVWHRRDRFTVMQLLKHSYRTAEGIPAYKRRIGKEYRPTFHRLVAPLWHAIKYRCTKGIVLTIREFASMVGYSKMEISRIFGSTKK